jgi:hypothetical protein
MSEPTTRTLEVPGAILAYDVRPNDASTDPVLLASAAQYLYFNQKKLDFDTKALAKSYYERALQLNPQYWQVRERLRAMNAHDWGSQIAEILQQNKTPKARYDAISALPETERLKYLPRMAEQSYMIGEYEDYSKHDKAAADADFEYAGKFAQDALNLGTKLPNHPFSSPAIYTGNMVLGTLAFKHGDRNTAVRYMLAASHAPASENLDSYLVFYTRLTGQLLKYGERDSVIEFLERIAQLSSRPDQKDYLLESANQIRNGYQPRWYPRETQQTEGRK